MLPGDRASLADKRTAHVPVSRLATKPGLRQGVANFQHAARRIGNAQVLPNTLCEYGGLIEAARRKPLRGKRQGDELIGTRIGIVVHITPNNCNHGVGKQLRERQIFIELEGLHQSIERKAVLKRGNGRIEVGWIGKALTARRRRRRRRGALWARAARGVGQIAMARAAEARCGTDSAERAILRKDNTEGWRSN